jgi:hypothetical protein
LDACVIQSSASLKTIGITVPWHSTDLRSAMMMPSETWVNRFLVLNSAKLSSRGSNSAKNSGVRLGEEVGGGAGLAWR